MSRVIVSTESDIEILLERKFNEKFQELVKMFLPVVPTRPDLSEPDQKFTVKQLAEYWQCHPQTIMQKKRKGELPFYQHGRKLMFSKREIDKLTENPVKNGGHK